MNKSNSTKTQKETDYLCQARRIVLKRLSGYHAKVYLFGSHARGDHHHKSDIDIANIHFKPFGKLEVAFSVPMKGFIWDMTPIIKPKNTYRVT